MLTAQMTGQPNAEASVHGDPRCRRSRADAAWGRSQNYPSARPPPDHARGAIPPRARIIEKSSAARGRAMSPPFVVVTGAAIIARHAFDSCGKSDRPRVANRHPLNPAASSIPRRHRSGAVFLRFRIGTRRSRVIMPGDRVGQRYPTATFSIRPTSCVVHPPAGFRLDAFSMIQVGSGYRRHRHPPDHGSLEAPRA
jgi:hypothetical protein